jgi:putative ABC transport system permease protein
MASLSPRWRKLARDASATRGRLLLMVAAIAVSVVAVGAVLGAYAILTREIGASYAGTRPASVTLELPGGADPALVAAVRARPGVAEAEAREVVLARARLGEEWRRLLLFVVDDFGDVRLNRFRPVDGAWPPPAGTMLVERGAVAILQAGTGQRVRVKPPHGESRDLEVSGLVHDPGLAPAWQERSGYGYVTRETLALLGETPVLHELRVEFSGRPREPAVLEARAGELARWLEARGVAVRELRIPPPAEHPHGRQMKTLLGMLLVFAGMALVLSATLVATSLASLLARQVREIGVMKTIGARAGQLAGMYAVLVGWLGLVAVLLALPLGVCGARFFAGVISRMPNFDLASTAIPGWVFVVEAVAGIVVPLLVAALPIRRASRTTVRATIDDHGVTPTAARPWVARLPAPLREALRRPARLALTLGLLAAGGAMFMTALDMKQGWQATVAKIPKTRFYDLEVRLQTPAAEAVTDRLRAVPGVRAVEAWGYAPSAFSRPGAIDVVRTYPDGGHGTLAMMGPPPATALVRFPVKAGRWLADGDDDEVVLNHAAAAQAPQLRVGSPVTLSLDGRPTTWTVAGIVEEIGSPAIAYVSADAFARASGTAGARLLRIQTEARSPAARTAVIRDVEDALAAAHVGVEAAMPLAELRTAVGDHIVVLVRTLVAMAAILAIVGILGLGSAMGVSVVERTRELGVMKTLGATPRRIVRGLVLEGLVIGALSWVLAVGLSVPLALSVGAIIGNLGFLAPLPLVVAPGAAAGWLGLVLVMSLIATLVPARRAAALSIREALARE